MTFRSASRLAGLAGLLVAASAPLTAQEAPATPDTLPRYVVEAVVVTTTRAPASRLDLPQQIEVVTSTDLQRTVASDLTEVLKENTTVDVIQFPGLLSGVSIRGFRPQYSGLTARTLILVDGRPAGANNLATLDLAGVERIEVLKGPASALYGSSAMGGVVNVVTRRSRGELGGRATLGYGSFGAYRSELVAGGDLAAGLDFDLALTAHGQTDGYRVGARRLLADDSVTKELRSGGSTRLAEARGDTVLAFSEHGFRSGSLRLGYAWGEAWRVDVRGSRFAAEGVQNPGDLNAPYDSRSLKDLERHAGEVALTGAVGSHALSLRSYLTEETSAYYNQAEAPHHVGFRTPSLWYGLQLQDVVSLDAHTLTLGVDHAVGRAESERFTAPGERGAPFSPNSGIHSTAAFAEGRLSLLDRRLTATLGGRLDRIRFVVEETDLLTNYGAGTEEHTVFTPSAGLQYRLPSGLRVHASGGRAFVAPDAFHVAGYAEWSAGDGGVNVTRGNPDLKPESSASWDAGLGFHRPALGIQADLTYFHTDVRDRISVEYRPGSGEVTAGGDTVRSVTTYVNADEARIRGVEASFGYDLGALRDYAYSLRLFAGATRMLRAEEVSGGVTTDIRNVADLNANFGVEYDDLRRFSTRLTGRYVGERLDTDFTDWMNPGDVRYPRFLVLDLSADVRFAGRYRLGLRMDNLTDENYYEVRGYSLPGRAVRLQAGVEF